MRLGFPPRMEGEAYGDRTANDGQPAQAGHEQFGLRRLLGVGEQLRAVRPAARESRLRQRCIIGLHFLLLGLVNALLRLNLKRALAWSSAKPVRAGGDAAIAARLSASPWRCGGLCAPCSHLFNP